MTIYELAEMIGTELEINYYHSQNQRMAASLKRVDILDGGLLIGAYGNGYGGDSDAAIADYVRQIKGKTVIYDARGPNRREYKVPESLTA